MIEAPHFSPAGARKGSAFRLPAAYFDGTVNAPVLHDAVTVHLANQRQGTHATKTRSFVSGGNQKPWKQKGTGRARQGSIRSPLWPGGGTVFGPQPRDYRLSLPRKVKQLARKSALNARASEGSLYVIERFEQQSPRTRELVALLTKLGVADRKVLVLTHGVSEAVLLSARNLPRVDVLPYGDATAYDVLWAEVILVEEPALGNEPAHPFVRPFVPAPKPEGAPVRERPRKPAKAPEEKPAASRGKKKAAKPAAAKATKPKASAKKPAAKQAPSKRERKPAPKKKGGK
ncbi:MAG TPA: 50S ribosomal protein L4 [Gemmatimonadales bacterium]|nr:50S ribosomal protein L4 [Gemmatimonadales bacterium]